LLLSKLSLNLRALPLLLPNPLPTTRAELTALLLQTKRRIVGFNNFEDRDNNNEEEEEETEHAVVVLFGTPIDMQRAQREREREKRRLFLSRVCECV